LLSFNTIECMTLRSLYVNADRNYYWNSDWKKWGERGGVLHYTCGKVSWWRRTTGTHQPIDNKHWRLQWDTANSTDGNTTNVDDDNNSVTCACGKVQIQPQWSPKLQRWNESGIRQKTILLKWKNVCLLQGTNNARRKRWKNRRRRTNLY